MSQYNTALVGDMIAGGPVATAKSNDELYPKVAAGDPEAREEMIQRNMSLVVNKVDSYIGCYPGVSHLRDDLISEGFVGLTHAVNKMAEAGPKEKPNPTGYMSYWIMAQIGATVDKESANGASTATIYRSGQKGEELAHQVPMPNGTVTDIVVDPTSMVDLVDLIDACCESEHDRIICQLRELGHSDKYIAERLELPVSTTYMMRRAIYGRFLQKSGLKGEV